jgi:hypothetical protein
LKNNFCLHVTNNYFLLFHFFLHYEFSLGNSVLSALILLDNSFFFELDLCFDLKRKGLKFILLLVVFARNFFIQIFVENEKIGKFSSFDCLESISFKY